jgi:hypothetical protein
MRVDIEKLKSPNIKLAGLQIWIHGRQFSESEDYYDGNWLNVTAHCGEAGASVWVSGAIVAVVEIDHWLSSSRELLKGLVAKAELPCIEPHLYVILQAGSLGHVTMEVSITPDNMTQEHKFIFEIDQSYLPSLISQCEDVLKEYPVRGANS